MERGTVDRCRFLALLSDRLPDVAADIDECSAGLLHMEINILARASLAAIRSEDGVTLRSHLALVEDAFRNATPELRSALCTAYLEQIDFGGRRAMKIRAREMLSPQVSAEVDALKEFWDRQRLQP